MPQWLIALAWVSVCAGVMTALGIAADVFRHPQKMKIMSVVWPVTGLYLPVAAWFFYRRMGRPMSADSGPMKAEPPHWQRVFVSATHCGSGCVIGDVVAAPLVPLAGLTLFGERLFAEYAVEFAFAYLVGIAFQYLPIRAMRHVSPREALIDAIKADTLSLIAFEVGMFLWMALAYFLFLRAARPDAFCIVFWLLMQVGMVLGFLTTYPANWLLLKWGIKRGM